MALSAQIKRYTFTSKAPQQVDMPTHVAGSNLVMRVEQVD
jgi:hypothetical protein